MCGPPVFEMVMDKMLARIGCLVMLPSPTPTPEA